MLSVVCIPAFNVESQIKDVIKKSQNYVDKANLGKGAALKTLFIKAKELGADIVITIDGDGQFLPEEIPKLIEPIKTNNFDIVIGNRFLDKHEMPVYRKAVNKILDKFTKLAANLPFEDTQSGFRSYSKNAIEKISFFTNGFGVDSEILVDAVNKKLKVTEENITVIYNTGEKTSTKNPISHSMGVIASIIELIAINHPLRYLGIPGLIFLIIGIVYSIVVIALFNDTRYFSIPSTLLALGSLVIGLMLLLMSVVLYSISHRLQHDS